MLTKKIPQPNGEDKVKVGELEESIKMILDATSESFPFVEFGLLVSQYCVIVHKYSSPAQEGDNQNPDSVKVQTLVSHLSVEDLDNYSREYKKELTSFGVVSIPYLTDLLLREEEILHCEKKPNVIYPCGSNFNDAREVLGKIVEENIGYLVEEFNKARHTWCEIKTGNILHDLSST